MKVKFKYAIMAVAALTLGLTSCSNNDEVTGGETDNGTVTSQVRMHRRHVQQRRM